MKSILKLFNAQAKRIHVSRKSSLNALTWSLTIRKILHCPNNLSHTKSKNLDAFALIKVSALTIKSVFLSKIQSQ